MFNAMAGGDDDDDVGIGYALQMSPLCIIAFVHSQDIFVRQSGFKSVLRKLRATCTQTNLLLVTKTQK